MCRVVLRSASLRIAIPLAMHAGLFASLIVLSASCIFASAISRGVVALMVVLSSEDIMFEFGFEFFSVGQQRGWFWLWVVVNNTVVTKLGLL